MPEHRVVVVGAGMGGLVSALLLAHQGHAVTLVDASDQVGGKLRQTMVDGAPIDSGPTVFTMRWVFDRIFDLVGSSLEAELRTTPLAVLARHAWEDGSQLDLHADPRHSAEAVAQFAGPAEAKRFVAFCDTARAVYRSLEGPFIRGPSPTLRTMITGLGFEGLRHLTRIGPMQSLWDSLGRQFHDPRLRQLFARYSTYCGSSPWSAPATLMLIAQVELDGVWSIEGGMHALATRLAALAQKHGATLRLGTSCTRIVKRNGRVAGIETREGERIDADSVVFNGDIAALREGLLGGAAQRSVPTREATRSLSALTWLIHAPTQGFALDRHNVFFRRDYAREFRDIFGAERLPTHPTVYVCAQDRGTAAIAGGAERLLCLVNAPAVGDSDRLTEEMLEECEQSAFDLLHRCGLRIRARAHQVVRTTPMDFHERFPATGGALYGQATHGWMSAFQRRPAATRLPGLFLAGGSVHPGPGVPMAALSGLQAVAALTESLASTRRFPRAATSGGTSMPSLMTGEQA